MQEVGTPVSLAHAGDELVSAPDAPEAAPPTPLAGVRQADRRFLAGCVSGLLIGAALAVPGAYALLRVGGARAQSGTQALNANSLATSLTAGLSALARKDAAGALDIFRATERAFPPNAKVQNNICVSLNELGRYAEAVTACQMALTLDPGFTLARNNLQWARTQLAKASATSSADTPRASR
jgi:tetratricopeptide (TPR) repeat protein